MAECLQIIAFITFITKEKHHFFNLQFLFLLSERGLSHESCLEFAIRGLVAYKPVAFKKTKCTCKHKLFCWLSRFTNFAIS